MSSRFGIRGEVLEFGVGLWNPGLGFRICGLGFGVQGFRVSGFQGFRVSGFQGFRVQGPGLSGTAQPLLLRRGEIDR